MTDPFDALRITDTPLEPRSEFAAELRHTLATALEDTNDRHRTPLHQPHKHPRKHKPSRRTSRCATPRAALAFYVEAFDAIELSRLVSDGDGRIGHAEIMIGNSKLMLADEYPEIDSVGPETPRRPDVFVHHRGARCRRVVRTRDLSRCNRRASCRRSVPRQPHGNSARPVRPSVDVEHSDRRLRSMPSTAGSPGKRATN